ncbi:MAG: amidohydrolase [Clostridia bacterium]|nr:amidohydrolase [Clostridia bacterium]
MEYTIIDCHTHIYPEKIAAKAVKSIGNFYEIDMGLDGTVGTLIQNSRSAGVSKCLALAVAVDAAHVQHINDFLIASVHAHQNFLYGFATLHPDMNDPGREVERILKAGMKGIKLHPDMQHFSLSEPRAQKLFAACEGVCPMLYHTGDKRYHNSNPSLIPPILKKYPRLQLICAHFGGYSEWDEAARCLADTHVYVDTSSSFFALSKERARELIDVYGEDRVLFGTDFPMWEAKPEIDYLLSLGLGDRALKKIFSGNFLRLLGE